jgi:hypothetical protein
MKHGGNREQAEPLGNYYLLNRKNSCVPEMGLVTVFCPLTTTGPGETLVQTAVETWFAADCKVNPEKSNPAILVGHVKMTFVPERFIVTFGANERLKTVPLPELPPPLAVP